MEAGRSAPVGQRNLWQMLAVAARCSVLSVGPYGTDPGRAARLGHRRLRADRPADLSCEESEQGHLDLHGHRLQAAGAACPAWMGPRSDSTWDTLHGLHPERCWALSSHSPNAVASARHCRSAPVPPCRGRLGVELPATSRRSWSVRDLGTVGPDASRSSRPPKRPERGGGVPVSAETIRGTRPPPWEPSPAGPPSVPPSERDLSRDSIRERSGGCRTRSAAAVFAAGLMALDCS